MFRALTGGPLGFEEYALCSSRCSNGGRSCVDSFPAACVQNRELHRVYDMNPRVWLDVWTAAESVLLAHTCCPCSLTFTAGYHARVATVRLRSSTLAPLRGSTAAGTRRTRTTRRTRRGKSDPPTRSKRSSSRWKTSWTLSLRCALVSPASTFPFSSLVALPPRHVALSTADTTRGSPSRGA